MTNLPKEFPLPRDAFDRQRSLIRTYIELPRSSSRLRARTTSVAVGAAALLGALLVTPAFGLGDRLMDLLQRPPAPPEVQAHFAESDALRQRLFEHAKAAGHELQDRFSRVVASEGRGVAAIESADGPVYLWAAPTEDGRQCWLIQAGAEAATKRPYGSGSCDSIETVGGIRPSTLWTAERPSVKIVHARVYDETITRIEVIVEGSTSVSLPVVAGHALDTVPKEVRVVAFVGRNEDAEEVTRTSLR
jgi:hypothetical protein